MERKIGEIFKHNDEWYQCIRSILTCSSCEIPRPCTKIRELGYCSPNMRNDKEQVVFKKLKKVGEPYEHCGKLYQCYKLPMEIEIRLLPNNCNPIGKDNLVEIEIKQNKEDMEEKKFCEKISKANEVNMVFKIASEYINGGITYDEFKEYMRSWVNNGKKEIKPNLKEFDLEAAKLGKPVCTRNGRKARIICFDKKCLDKQILIVLVDCGKEEFMYFYTTDGKCIDDFSSFDLMMLPEKKEGWINVYKSKDTIFKSEKEAKAHSDDFENYIATVKIEWEE